MIQITAQMRVLVAIEPVDGRKGIDALVRLCQEKVQEDPFSGCMFVFRSRSGTAIRLLTYDGQGYWLAQKRLSKGRFVWWPEGGEPAIEFSPRILAGFSPVQPIALDVLRTSGVLARGRLMAIRWPRAHSD